MKTRARLSATGCKADIANLEADYHLEIIGGRKIKLRRGEAESLMEGLLNTLPQNKEEVPWFPLPNREGEYTEFVISRWLLSDGCIPERIFDAKGPGRPIELPGPIGDLCRSVGGVSALASMMECSVDAIAQWAKGQRHPSGPARVLMSRIAEEFGSPALSWKVALPEDPEDMG